MSLYKVLNKGHPKKIAAALEKNAALAHKVFDEKEVPVSYRHLTPLMYTALKGMSELAEKLITKYNVNINEKVKQGPGQGYDAFMFATESSDKKFVALLLKKGLDPKATITGTEHQGMSYVDFAVKHGNTGIVELLVDAGGNIDIPGRIEKDRAAVTGDYILTYQYRNMELIDYYIAKTKQLENFLEGVIVFYDSNMKIIEANIRDPKISEILRRQHAVYNLLCRIISYYEKTIPNFAASDRSHYLLCTATMYKLTKMIKELNVDVNFIPKTIITALPNTEESNLLAGSLSSIAQFLERQDYKRFVNDYAHGLPPLAIAILWKNLAATEELIRKGADINYVIQEGPMAGLPIIVIAILCENQAILNCLAKAGVNLEAEIKGVKLAQGELPTMNVWEFSVGYVQKSTMPFGIFMGYFIQNKGEFNKFYREKQVTGLFAGILLNDISLIHFFTKYGVGINEPMSEGEYKGQTPLQVAIASGDKDILNILITEGNVNVNRVIFVAGKAISPLDYAVSLGFGGIVDILRKNAALTTTDLENQPDELEAVKQLVQPFSRIVNLSQDYQFFSVKENNNSTGYKSFITSKEHTKLSFSTLMANSDGSEESTFLPTASSHCKNIIAILEDVKSFGRYSLSHEMLCYERLHYHVLRLAVILNENISKYAPEWEKYLPIVKNLRLMVRHLHYYLNFENMMKFAYDVFKAFNGLIENKLGINRNTVNIHKELTTSVIYKQLNDCLNQTAISKMSGLNSKKIIYYDLIGIKKLLEPIDKPYKVKFYEDRIEALKMKFCRIGECYSQLIAVKSELSQKLEGILRAIRDEVGNIVAHEDAQLKTANSLVEVDSQKVYELAIKAVEAIALIKNSIPQISLNSQNSNVVLDNEGMQFK